MISVFFTSCVSTKLNREAKELSNSAKNIKNIGIRYSYIEKGDLYLNFFDSTINDFITEFNKEGHLFTINAQQPDDSLFVSLQFVKTKFASKNAITAGYIVSGLGLIALPIATYNASNGNLIVFAWFLPKDVNDFYLTQSKYLKLFSDRQGNKSIKSGAMFSTEENRQKNMKNAFSKALRRYFEGIEIDIKMKIKR